MENEKYYGFWLFRNGGLYGIGIPESELENSSMEAVTDVIFKSFQRKYDFPVKKEDFTITEFPSYEAMNASTAEIYASNQ